MHNSITLPLRRSCWKLLEVVFALDKFRSYLLGSKVIVYSDHATLKYRFSKKMLNLASSGGSFYCKSLT
jgi:hypothetical protein